MPNATDLVMLAVATWRLSAFLMWEEGPFLIARRLRDRIGIVHDDDGRPAGYPEGTLGGIFACMYCMSIWAGALMLGLFLSGPGIVVVIVFALSGAAALVEAVNMRLNRS